MQLSALTTLSPIDGRYQDKATALRAVSYTHLRAHETS